MELNEEDDAIERERMIRSFQFLYHGRFTEEEVRRIFDHVKWENRSAAVNFVQKSSTIEIRSITGKKEDGIAEIKADPSVLDVLQNGITTTLRQFACMDCDHVWWRKVPIRKEVSQCKICKQKYDPVPREYEWGLATYDCEVCGNEFSGSGQKNTSAPCYECEQSVFPINIKPFWKRGYRKSRGRHCCDAPDCTGLDPVPIHEVDPNRIYDDGTTNSSRRGSFDMDEVSNQFGQLNVRQNKSEGSLPIRKQESLRSNSSAHTTNGPTGTDQQPKPNNTRGTSLRGKSTCVSPIARYGKKRVVYASQKHISTGSTIGTFLSQSDQTSAYAPTLPSIPERGGRRSGRGGSRRY